MATPNQKPMPVDVEDEEKAIMAPTDTPEKQTALKPKVFAPKVFTAQKKNDDPVDTLVTVTHGTVSVDPGQGHVVEVGEHFLMTKREAEKLVRRGVVKLAG